MWDSINEWIADMERKHIIDPANDFLKENIRSFLAETGRTVWDWFVQSIPDLVGYGTITAGVWVMLGAMIGRGGMLKPLGILAGGVITAVCILEAN